jgi:hypothetical protein
MFLATEVSQPFTVFDVLLIALNAVAPIAAMIWVKVVLYRRREDKDRAEALRQTDHTRRRIRRRPAKRMRTIPHDFRLKRPLGLYVGSNPPILKVGQTRAAERSKNAYALCGITPAQPIHHTDS